MWLLVASVAIVVAAVAFVYPIDRTAIGPWRFSVRDPLRPLFLGLLAAAWFAGRRWSVLARLSPAASALSQGVAAASSALLEVYRTRVPQAGRSLVVAFGRRPRGPGGLPLDIPSDLRGAPVVST